MDASPSIGLSTQIPFVSPVNLSYGEKEDTIHNEIPIVSQDSERISYQNFWSTPYSLGLMEFTLIEIVQKSRAEVIKEFSDMYGDRLINELFERYGFQDKEAFSEEDIQLLTAGVAARVTFEDLKEFYNKLQNVSTDVHPFFKRRLVRYAKTHEFNSLSDHKLGQLLDFFRKKGIKFPELKNPSTQVQQDQLLLEYIDCYKKFDCNVTPSHVSKEQLPPFAAKVDELVCSEYMSRRLAYAPLEKGMILPSPTKSGTPRYFVVEGAIDKEGFAYFLLKEAAKQASKKVHVLFRGTDPTSLASVSHNLAESPGAKVFRKNQKEIFADLNAVFASGQISSIEFNGHSQGGALAQNGVAVFLQKINEPDSPFQSSKEIRLLVWNSPSVLQEHAEAVNDYAAQIAMNHKTLSTKLLFAYNFVEGDIVHRFGEALIAALINSTNVSRQIICFKPTLTDLLSCHIQSVFQKNSEDDADPIITAMATEILDEIDELQKMIRFIDVLLETFGTDKQNREFAEEEKAHFDASIAYLNAMMKTYPEFALCLNKTEEDLVFSKILLAVELNELREQMEGSSEKLSAAMNLSVYSAFSQMDKYTASLVLGGSKETLYNLVDPTVPSTQKGVTIVKATGAAAVGGAALYGIGALALANPLTAIVGGTVVLGAIGTHYTVKKIRKKVWG